MIELSPSFIEVVNREKEIEQSLIKMNTGPMPNSSITKIFKTIIEAGRELQ